MNLPFYQVDAFTDSPFSGNPAAIVLLSEQGEDGWLQQVAMEMNLPETAFLCKWGDGYNLRWFTPEVEIDLCGHATLASAHILWEQHYLAPQEEAVFLTRSGRLSAAKHGHWIELDFPAEREQQAVAPAGLLEALGVEAVYTGKNRFDYLLEVESEEVVRNMRPDSHALKKISQRGAIVTAKSVDGKFDFVSRFFAPIVGIDEDPVTGSAHCCLGPYWQRKLGKNELLAYQASARGGVVKVRVAGERVYLGGQAVTVLRGALLA